MMHAPMLQEYAALIRGAAQLRDIANEKKRAGPSFWEDMRACTMAAVRGETKAPGGCTWRLTPTQMIAIAEGLQDSLAPAWLAAAKILELQAARMLAPLEEERARLDAAISELRAAETRARAEEPGQLTGTSSPLPVGDRERGG